MEGEGWWWKWGGGGCLGSEVEQWDCEQWGWHMEVGTTWFYHGLWHWRKKRLDFTSSGCGPAKWGLLANLACWSCVSWMFIQIFIDYLLNFFTFVCDETRCESYLTAFLLIRLSSIACWCSWVEIMCLCLLRKKGNGERTKQMIDWWLWFDILWDV